MQNADINVHELKGGENASRYDLYNDTAGNIHVKPNGGAGPGDKQASTSRIFRKNRSRLTVPEHIRVDLSLNRLSGHPSEVSQLLGLEPSKTWQAGQPIERSARCYQSNGWRISAPNDIENIEAAVDALLAQMAARWELLRKLSVDWRVELSVVVYAAHQVPAIHFRNDQVKRLAELSSKIDVDVYCLGADDPNGER